MNPFDIFLLVTCAVAAVMGWRKGFVNQLGQVAALVVAVVASRLLGQRAAAWMLSLSESEASAWITVMGYVATFAAAYLVVLLLSRTLSRMLSALKLGAVNGLAGATFKVAEWLVLVSICLTLWFAIRPADRRAVVGEGHPMRAFVADLAPALVGQLSELNLVHAPGVINNEGNQNER